MEFLFIEVGTLYAYSLDSGTEVEEVLFRQFVYFSHDTAELCCLLMQETDFLGFGEECHLLDTTAPQATKAMVDK